MPAIFVWSVGTEKVRVLFQHQKWKSVCFKQDASGNIMCPSLPNKSLKLFYQKHVQYRSPTGSPDLLHVPLSPKWSIWLINRTMPTRFGCVPKCRMVSFSRGGSVFQMKSLQPQLHSRVETLIHLRLSTYLLFLPLQKQRARRNRQYWPETSAASLFFLTSYEVIKRQCMNRPAEFFRVLQCNMQTLPGAHKYKMSLRFNHLTYFHKLYELKTSCSLHWTVVYILISSPPHYHILSPFHLAKNHGKLCMTHRKKIQV